MSWPATWTTLSRCRTHATMNGHPLLENLSCWNPSRSRHSGEFSFIFDFLLNRICKNVCAMCCSPLIPASVFNCTLMNQSCFERFKSQNNILCLCHLPCPHCKAPQPFLQPDCPRHSLRALQAQVVHLLNDGPGDAVEVGHGYLLQSVRPS